MVCVWLFRTCSLPYLGRQQSLSGLCCNWAHLSDVSFVSSGDRRDNFLRSIFFTCLTASILCLEHDSTNEESHSLLVIFRSGCFVWRPKATALSLLINPRCTENSPELHYSSWDKYTQLRSALIGGRKKYYYDVTTGCRLRFTVYLSNRKGTNFCLVTRAIVSLLTGRKGRCGSKSYHVSVIKICDWKLKPTWLLGTTTTQWMAGSTALLSRLTSWTMARTWRALFTTKIPNLQMTSAPSIMSLQYY